VRLGHVASVIVNANQGMIGLAADINLESNYDRNSWVASCDASNLQRSLQMPEMQLTDAGARSLQ